MKPRCRSRPVAALLLAGLGTIDCGPRPGEPRPAPPTTVSASARHAPTTSQLPPGGKSLFWALAGAESEAECGQYAHVEMSSADMPSAAARAVLRRCDAEAAYYGIGRPVDYVEARSCAASQLEHRTRGEPFFFDDCGCPALLDSAAILMMVYANGRGVPVDLGLARRFACEYGGSPAELNLRLHGLDAASQSGGTQQPFDVCDAAGSGYMSGLCAAHRERSKAAARSIRLGAVRQQLPTAELETLVVSAHHFFDARAQLEVDLTGTARSMLEIEERSRLEDSFIDALERLQRPDFPPRSTAEAELRKRLEQATSCDPHQPAPADLPVGMPTCADMLQAQGAWLPYSEAFVALARKVRPERPATRVRAWLIKERLRQLGDDP